MTTPYVTGTVSVTAGSAIVTGVGTGWLTSGLVAGQFGLDSANGNPVPVLSIDSDTQITLAKPWRGTTASAQGYWITYDTTPGQQTVANAQRLAEYIARLDKAFFSAFANVTPAVDTLPYFGAGAAGAITPFGAAARSLLGLTVAADTLPYFNSATGAATTSFNAAARALLAGGQLPNAQVRNDLTPDKAFRRGNILGTVSQSAGVPTGAIIERGSNANGEYVRFADGTQICTRSVTNLGPVNVAAGSGFRSDGIQLGAFPTPFAANPICLVSVQRSNAASVWGAFTNTGGAPLSQWGNISIMSWTSAASTLFQAEAVAIGRWF